MNDHDQLMKLAEAVADDEDVDWEDESLDDSRVHRLREISAVAAAYRSVDEEGDDCLFSWGHLKVMGRLGEGSYGEVYRARDPVLERDVALKLRRQGPSHELGAGRRFVEEARRLARVSHPNVLTVHGADVHDGRVGLWTELVDGRPLTDVLAEEGVLGAREATAVGLEVCQALAAVHAAGLIHGDVKAANVFREQGGRIVLGDFGASVDAREGMVTFLSPGSAAPEVLKGEEATPASDVYSLGALLYQLTSDRLPVEGESLEDLASAFETLPLRDLRPDLPAEFVSVVEQSLRLDPQDRPSSVGEVERLLLGSLGRRDAGGDESGAGVRTWGWRKWVLGAVAAVSLGALVALGVFRAQLGPEARTPVANQSEGAFQVSAAIHSHGLDRGPELLADGDAVAPGDWLSMDVECEAESHVWVLNGDRNGELFVLFPIPGLDLENPLAPGRHRLPGTADGVPQNWQVTSTGGKEVFLVVASRSPLPNFQNTVERLQAAGEDPSSPQAGPATTLRGVGGLVDAVPSVAGESLEAIYQDLLARQARDSDIWLSRVELANPGQL